MSSEFSMERKPHIEQVAAGLTEQAKQLLFGITSESDKIFYVFDGSGTMILSAGQQSFTIEDTWKQALVERAIIELKKQDLIVFFDQSTYEATRLELEVAEELRKKGAAGIGRR